MTWQYLFWLLLRRNSNKLTEMYHLLANIFVLKSIKLTLFHHYNLCGKITRRWHFCGFSFFLNSNRQIDWTISCKKYGAWNIFLFTGDLQSLILVYLMKQTSANNGGYLIWVLTLFVGAPPPAPQLSRPPALLLTSSQVEVEGAAVSGKSGSEIHQYLDRQVNRLEWRTKWLCLCLSTFLELRLQI